MKIKSLEEIGKLPVAVTDEAVDDMVYAVLDLYYRQSSLPADLVAETIVDAMDNICYSERMSENAEHKVLIWISQTFDQKNEKYLDALATIYTNMKSLKAAQDLKFRLNSAENSMVKKLLKEAIDEI